MNEKCRCLKCLKGQNENVVREEAWRTRGCPARSTPNTTSTTRGAHRWKCEHVIRQLDGKKTTGAYIEMGLPCSSQLITSLIRQLSALPIPEREEEDPIAEGPQPYKRVGGLNDAPNDNPLAKLPADTLAKVKPLLLTLHTIFPNELLLALDILDRKLVTRYITRQNTQQYAREEGNREEGEGEIRADASDEDGRNSHGIYFVLSSAATATSTNNRWGESHSHPLQVEQSYEVCLNAWNCTCSAFTLAAFQDLALEGANHEPSRSLDTEHQDQQADRITEGQEQAQGQERGKELGTSEARDGKRKPPDWIFGGNLTRSSTCSRQCVFMHDSPAVCKHLLACVLCSQCPELFGSGVSFIHIDEEELAARHAGWAG